VTTGIWQPISFHCICCSFFQFPLSLHFTGCAILPALWSKLLKSHELSCLNTCPWMSRPKLWDSVHSFEPFVKYHDANSYCCRHRANGWIMYLKRPPSSWTELTLGFLLQINSEMVAGCLCWVHAQWLECSGFHTVILERPTNCLLHTESHALVHLKDKKSSWLNNNAHYINFYLGVRESTLSRTAC
jgi:hypothetical protein